MIWQPARTEWKVVCTSKQVTEFVATVTADTAEDLLREAIIEAVVIHYQQSARFRVDQGLSLTARPTLPYRPRAYALALDAKRAALSRG